MIKKYTVDTPYPVGPVHFYVKEYDDFLVLFDTGPNTNHAKEFLKQSIDLSKLKYLFVTHCHADHYGLIQFIKENSDAEIFISKYDLFRLYNLDLRIKAMSRILKEIGMADTTIEKIIGVLCMFAKEVPVPDGIRVLEEADDILEDLKISYVRCPGHSQSDIVYLLDGKAITGDVFLNGIFQTPLLDIDADYEDDRFINYLYFCDTIKKMKELEKKYEFLPGHRDYIDSVDERVKFYVSKMCERMVSLKKYLKLGDILKALKTIIPEPDAEPFKTYIKLSEILFFKDFYENPKLLLDSLKDAKIVIDNKDIMMCTD
ncbi:MBL fold metallo-hydrolase [Deferribacter autotrophicus]|uniref:MBL fold metallo-hydrolase n=1 Tax=Deferribacter autotrophicus TaxID=500465 RepID=UPI00165DF92B|nr:MBL fold metallo-hydrolase [Deferribacter autotrophicus]